MKLAAPSKDVKFYLRKIAVELAGRVGGYAEAERS